MRQCTGRFSRARRCQEQDFLKRVGESKNDVFWTIEADGRAIGVTGIHEIDWINAHGRTGTVIGAKDRWGKGYACARRLGARAALTRA